MVRVLVCIRIVPDREAEVKLSDDGASLDLFGVKLTANEYDLYAMEEAVRINERWEAHVTAVTVGPAELAEPFKKAMALGANDGFVIEDDGWPLTPSAIIAAKIAEFSRDKNFDLILCGVMSEDLQRCQTGPILAQSLGIRAATTVIEMELDPENRAVTCARELEGGSREKIRLPLPALIAVQSGINTPRYASLSNVLRVKGMDVPVLESKTDEVKCAPALKRLHAPKRVSDCEMLEGSLEEMALALIEKIRARTPVL